MAIVWPCPLSVDAYVEAGREIELPRPDCPSCALPMGSWSGYSRIVREGERDRVIFVPRFRCSNCSVTHALLPCFVLVGRLYVTETIGSVIESVLDERSGVRPAARSFAVPHTTAREWLRRFGARARELAVSFAALAVELGAEARAPLEDAAPDALFNLRASFGQASELPGWLVLGLWRFASAVSGGGLLRANTNTPYLFLGRRRFMPPVPFPKDEEERSDGT
jgi:transposase-like protein